MARIPDEVFMTRRRAATCEKIMQAGTPEAYLELLQEEGRLVEEHITTKLFAEFDDTNSALPPEGDRRIFLGHPDTCGCRR